MDALWSDMDARCMGRLKIPVSPNAAGAVTAAAAPTDCALGPARTSSRQTVETRALDLRAVSGLLRAGSLADREFLTPGRNAEDLGVEVFSPSPHFELTMPVTGRPWDSGPQTQFLRHQEIDILHMNPLNNLFPGNEVTLFAQVIGPAWELAVAAGEASVCSYNRTAGRYCPPLKVPRRGTAPSHSYLAQRHHIGWQLADDLAAERSAARLHRAASLEQTAIQKLASR
jgi:hypothetical protein